MSTGTRARITAAEVTLGNKLVIGIAGRCGSGFSSLTVRRCCAQCRQQTLRRIYRRSPARAQSGIAGVFSCSGRRAASRSGLNVLQVLEQTWVIWLPAERLPGVGAR
jgi:hypothetical protein